MLCLLKTTYNIKKFYKCFDDVIVLRTLVEMLILAED